MSYALERAREVKTANAALRRALLPENGKLQKLQPKHEMVLTLAMQGKTQPEIALTLNLSIQRVYMILHEPIVQEHRKARLRDVDERFINMNEKVVDTFYEALDQEQEMDIRLSAADKWLRATGRYDRRDREHVNNFTLEDVVSALVQRHEQNIQVNVQVNTTTQKDE
ncbi:MAG: hypothetical protein ACREBW_10410 [Candidatus Micrarchaeaceae archaeon]